MTAACMGGWCQQRDHCERHTQDDRRVVAERLCDRGNEEPETEGGHWQRRDGWVDLLRRPPPKREVA